MSLYQRITSKKRPSSRGSFVIAIGDLMEIWTNEELQNFVQPTLTDEDIWFAKNHLLRTISFLIYIGAPKADEITLDLIRTRKHFDKILHLPEAHDPKFSLNGHTQEFFELALPLFTAPILMEGEDATLEDVQQMPLIEQSKESLGCGMTGPVFEYKILPGHFKRRYDPTPTTEQVVVAVKTISKSSASPTREITVLRQLRDLMRDKGGIQICPCITIVKEGHQYHSLSPRADSNLRGIYGNLETRIRDSSHWVLLRESIGQIKGIVEAVVLLHETPSIGQNSCYCHMDIKPDNILVFQSPSSNVGIWKLTDFGITTISVKKRQRTEGGARQEGFGTHMTITVGTSPGSAAGRYQPPEVNDNLDKWNSGDTGKYMGRGSDIWSLACVFAEVVAAIMGELGDLNNNTTECFYDKEAQSLWSCPPIATRPSPSYRRHPYFNRWLKRLWAGRTSEPSLKLCHELIDKMTDTNRMRRLKSQQVLDRINKFLKG
ncbi:kinase-like domain-containing protein [Rostrohypoxylon terebratum]|nr:kinase-like domain-containing protein [Rostrohypoxylon terebratum]